MFRAESVQYWALSKLIVKKLKSAAGRKGGPNLFVIQTTSICPTSATTSSRSYLFVDAHALLEREFALIPTGKNRSGQVEIEDH